MGKSLPKYDALKDLEIAKAMNILMGLSDEEIGQAITILSTHIKNRKIPPKSRISTESLKG